MEWQPIETAPKDAQVIVWCPGDRSQHINAMTYIAFQFTDAGDWVRHASGNEFESVVPTHWMPLPNPPAPDLGPMTHAERDAYLFGLTLE